MTHERCLPHCITNSSGFDTFFPSLDEMKRENPFIKKCLIKQLRDWKDSKATDDERVMVLPSNNFVLYEMPFKFGIQVSLSDFQIRATNHFEICYIQFLLNYWRIWVAFEVLCMWLKVRSTPTLFRTYYKSSVSMVCGL